MNSKDCRNAKILRCSPLFSCGLGCEHIYYSLAFAVAYGMKRILVYSKRSDFHYEVDEYERYYEPISEGCLNWDFRNEGGVDWRGN